MSKPNSAIKYMISFLFVLTFVGMLYSTFLLSFSYFLFAGYGVYLIGTRRIKISWKAIPWQFWGLISFFFIYFVSGLWSDNMSYWLSRIRLKLPFLMFPFLILILPKLKTSTVRLILTSYVVIVVFSIFPVLIDYLQRFQEINSEVLKGKGLETPNNHIRYSMMLAWGMGIAFHESFQVKLQLGDRLRRALFGLSSVLLFMVLHVLAVRTGLVLAYFFILMYVFFYMRWSIKYKVGLIVGLFLMVFVAVQTLPTLKNKWAYMVETFEKATKEKMTYAYSDGDRYTSIKVGVELALEHFWFGVGAGDIKEEIAEYRKAHYVDQRVFLPHNQFVTYWLMTGVFGLLMFIFCYLSLFTLPHIWRAPVFMFALSLVFISCFVENTFESALGVSIFIYPLLLFGLKHKKSPEEPSF